MAGALWSGQTPAGRVCLRGSGGQQANDPSGIPENIGLPGTPIDERGPGGYVFPSVVNLFSGGRFPDPHASSAALKKRAVGPCNGETRATLETFSGPPVYQETLRAMVDFHLPHSARRPAQSGRFRTGAGWRSWNLCPNGNHSHGTAGTPAGRRGGPVPPFSDSGGTPAAPVDGGSSGDQRPPDRHPERRPRSGGHPRGQRSAGEIHGAAANTRSLPQRQSLPFADAIALHVAVADGFHESFPQPLPQRDPESVALRIAERKLEPVRESQCVCFAERLTLQQRNPIPHRIAGADRFTGTLREQRAVPLRHHIADGATGNADGFSVTVAIEPRNAQPHSGGPDAYTSSHCISNGAAAAERKPVPHSNAAAITLADDNNHALANAGHHANGHTDTDSAAEAGNADIHLRGTAGVAGTPGDRNPWRHPGAADPTGPVGLHPDPA